MSAGNGGTTIGGTGVQIFQFVHTWSWLPLLVVPMSLKYFSDEEAKGLDPELMSKLDTARAVAGIPFKITSGLRTCAANGAALGVEHSSHLSGKAVDLAVSNSRERYLIVKALLGSGITRIGAYNAHVHCDVDSNKDPQVLWVGVSH